MIDQSFTTFPIFDQFKELICVFSTRLGGYSRGNFSSLNLGNTNRDEPESVTKNRILFFEKLGINHDEVALPGQIHSANIKYIDSPGIVYETDALITSQKRLFLGVQTADCLPVFFYCPKLQTVAVTHAGWRGAVNSIVLKTVDMLLDKPSILASDVYVAIGPGIQKECFEVRADVFKQFPKNVLLSHPDNSKRYLNLSAYLRMQLLSRKIPAKQIYQSKDCTKCNWKKYFSFRRDGKYSGRMMGIIGIRI